MMSMGKMNRSLCLLALVGFFFAMMMPVQVHSTGEGFKPLTRSSAPETYIVYMAQGDSVDAASDSTPEERYAAKLRNAMQGSDPSVAGTSDDDTAVTLTYVYDSAAVRGFAAPMDSVTAETLRGDPEVMAVVPDGTVEPHTTHTPDFLGLSSGKLWPQSKQGQDVIVGIIDTGVWPESQSFSDAGIGPIPAKWKGICQEGTRFTKLNCNKKLIGARFFYKGHQAKEGVNLTSQVRIVSKSSDSHSKSLNRRYLSCGFQVCSNASIHVIVSHLCMVALWKGPKCPSIDSMICFGK